MPVHMPGSLWAWSQDHFLEATLIWTLLGWGRGLSAPPLQPLAFVPLVGLACPGRWLALQQLPAWASCGMLVVSGSLCSSGGMWMMVIQTQLPSP